MKIAFLVGQFPVLSETFIIDQVTGLLERGHDVHVYAQWTPTPEVSHEAVTRYDLLSRTSYQPRIPERRLPRLLRGAGLLATHGLRHPRLTLRTLDARRYGRYAASLSLLYTAVPLLGSPDYDIVHCHFGPLALLGSMLHDAGIVRGRLVASFYGFDVTRHVRQFGRDVYRPLFARADLVLGLSEHMRRQLIDLGCDETRVRRRHLGTDCNRFQPASAPREDGPLRILSVGRLVEKKGFESAVKALARLAETGCDFQWTLAGDGPLRGELDALVAQCQLTDRARMLGPQTIEQVRDHLQNADILLAPSVTAADGDTEGIPTVIQEGMASGLPVVTTRHSGIPELVENDVSGIMVAERDDAALAEALAWLAADPDLRARLGRGARQCVEERFNIDRQIDELCRLYESIGGPERPDGD